jgi:hypothetical protein
MIGNDYRFWLGKAEINKTEQVHNEDTNEMESVTVYPSNQEIIDWMKELFSKELAFKPLPAKAIENLLAKGLAPKPQASEVLSIIITISRTHIIILVHNPRELDLSEIPLKHDQITNLDSSDTIYLIESSEVFKDQDKVMQNLFDYLKSKNIYVPDTDDEDD